MTTEGAYFPPAAAYGAGPERYLEIIRRARETVEIPIIASLSGVTDAVGTGGPANYYPSKPCRADTLDIILIG